MATFITRMYPRLRVMAQNSTLQFEERMKDGVREGVLTVTGKEADFVRSLMQDEHYPLGIAEEEDSVIVAAFGDDDVDDSSQEQAPKAAKAAAGRASKR